MSSHSNKTLEADCLVVGAGAMGMAFADVIVAQSQASVVIVDRHDRPGGHWNDAYPFVRLHSASASYGVNSAPLGQGDGKFVSLTSGAEFRVNVARKTVDATFTDTAVPSRRPPRYAIGKGVCRVSPNELGSRPTNRNGTRRSRSRFDSNRPCDAPHRLQRRRHPLARAPAPVFGNGSITLQAIRTCQQCFSAAHIELNYDCDAQKNQLSQPIPLPDHDIDWLKMFLANLGNQQQWRRLPELRSWITASRLDLNHRRTGPLTPDAEALVHRFRDGAGRAGAKLAELLRTVPGDSTGRSTGCSAV